MHGQGWGVLAQGRDGRMALRVEPPTLLAFTPVLMNLAYLGRIPWSLN